MIIKNKIKLYIVAMLLILLVGCSSRNEIQNTVEDEEQQEETIEEIVEEVRTYPYELTQEEIIDFEYEFIGSWYSFNVPKEYGVYACYSLNIAPVGVARINLPDKEFAEEYPQYGKYTSDDDWVQESNILFGLGAAWGCTYNIVSITQTSENAWDLDIEFYEEDYSYDEIQTMSFTKIDDDEMIVNMAFVDGGVCVELNVPNECTYNRLTKEYSENSDDYVQWLIDQGETNNQVVKEYYEYLEESEKLKSKYSN